MRGWGTPIPRDMNYAIQNIIEMYLDSLDSVHYSKFSVRKRIPRYILLSEK